MFAFCDVLPGSGCTYKLYQFVIGCIKTPHTPPAIRSVAMLNYDHLYIWMILLLPFSSVQLQQW